MSLDCFLNREHAKLQWYTRTDNAKWTPGYVFGSQKSTSSPPKNGGSRGRFYPQNAPSKGVLDRSTPLNGGHIYSDNDDTTLSRFGRIGRESEQIAPPAFLVTRPRCEHRLGKKGPRFLCVSPRAPPRGVRDFFVYLREPLGGGVYPKMHHPKVYLI